MQVPSSGYALALITAGNQLSHFFVFNQLASICGCKALLDFPDKPVLVTEGPLNRIAHECFRIASALGCNAVNLGLNIRAEVHVHVRSVEIRSELVNRSYSCPTPAPAFTVLRAAATVSLRR